ncbi:MAG TPA: hypothetical protein VN857_00015 [Chthoniobacterales bacterium]|nr:hypothetical protein [Chthoniobacterales bacterium]
MDCRPALQNWHDAAGFSVLCLSVLLLWVIAQRFRKRVEFRGLNGVALKPFTTPVIAGFGSWILFFCSRHRNLVPAQRSQSLRSPIFVDSVAG